MASREGAREVGELVDLRMIEPGVEGQPEAAEHGEALAEGLVGEQAGRRAVGGIADGGIRVPGGDVADAAEAVAAGTDVRLQHRLDPAAERQIGVADDAGAQPGLAVDAAGAHGGDAVDELGLADGAHLLGARGAYMARACTNTVAMMLWPLPVSASSSSSR